MTFPPGQNPGIFFDEKMQKLVLPNALRYCTISWLTENRDLEKSRSWPSAHDWKSCIPQKGIEGSNPSFSAKQETARIVLSGLFFYVLPAFSYNPKLFFDSI